MHFGAAGNKTIRPYAGQEDLISGRLAILLGIAVFIATYIFLLSHLGIVRGIAIAWLPSGFLSWAAIIAAYHVMQFCLKPQLQHSLR